MRFPSLIRCLLLGGLAAVGSAWPAVRAQDGTAEAEWQKFKGKPEPITAAPAFATPGMYLSLGERKVAFPAGGLAIDLPLDAELAIGKPVKAALQPNRALWIDLDGDGKATGPERFNPTKDGYGPITLALKYKNETQAPYSFYLVATGMPGTYRLVTGQMIRFTVSWRRRQSTLILLDQNNNGRYDDAGKDVLLIDSRPGCFLAKTATLGGDADTVVEIIVYPDGTTLEMREYTGPTGVLDMVSSYKPAQDGITVCHIAVENELSRPGFSSSCPRARVPVGSYQFQMASLKRGSEEIRVDKGALPPVGVEKDKSAALAWGGAVEIRYGFRRDGENLVFDGFKFVGKTGGEQYHTQPPQTTPLSYRVEQFVPNSTPLYPSTSVQLGAGSVELDDASDPRAPAYKPVLIKHKSRHMFLAFHLNYTSGVMGVVEVHDKLEFTPVDEKK